MHKILLVICFFFFLNISTQANDYPPFGYYSLYNPEPTENLFRIYPNPASDFIRLNTIEGVQSIAIYNLIGRKIKHFEVQKGKSYNISDLQKGMYLVQIINNDGSIIITQRLRKR